MRTSLLEELTVRQLCNIVREEGVCPLHRACMPDYEVEDCASCQRSWDALAEIERRSEALNIWRSAVRKLVGIPA